MYMYMYVWEMKTLHKLEPARTGVVCFSCNSSLTIHVLFMIAIDMVARVHHNQIPLGPVVAVHVTQTLSPVVKGVVHQTV